MATVDRDHVLRTESFTGAGGRLVAIAGSLDLRAIALILAWKNAGYIGLDRYLLPVLGTPWKQTRPIRTVATPKPVTVTT